MTDPIKDTTVKVLERAAQLIRQGFVKGRFAAAADGDTTYENRADAVKWCALGAMNRSIAEMSPKDMGVRIELQSVSLNAVVNVLEEKGLGTNIAAYNDKPETTAEDIVSVFCSAAERLRNN